MKRVDSFANAICWPSSRRSLTAQLSSGMSSGGKIISFF